MSSSKSTKRIRTEPTTNLQRVKQRSHKPVPEKERKVCISRCKHRSTTMDDDFHIIACTSCGEVVENASSVPRSVGGPATLLGGNVGLCTYEFIKGKREGTICKAYTRDRMTTRCHKHKPKKNTVEKVSTKCEHIFAYGIRKGTVCGVDTNKGANRCYKHKTKKT